jgi:hypothetical protein
MRGESRRHSDGSLLTFDINCLITGRKWHSSPHNTPDSEDTSVGRDVWYTHHNDVRPVTKEVTIPHCVSNCVCYEGKNSIPEERWHHVFLFRLEREHFYASFIPASCLTQRRTCKKPGKGIFTTAKFGLNSSEKKKCKNVSRYLWLWTWISPLLLLLAAVMVFT